VQKRSLTIAGHRTSIALEAEFWSGLEALAAAEHLHLTELIRRLDQTRGGPNLTSALRIAVLDFYRSGTAFKAAE